MNKILIITIAGIMTLLLSIPAILLSKSYNSEPVIDHTLTKAICDSNNYCEDYNISCKNKNVISISPTRYAIKFPMSWKDPRTPEDISNLC